MSKAKTFLLHLAFGVDEVLYEESKMKQIVFLGEINRIFTCGTSELTDKIEELKKECVEHFCTYVKAGHSTSVLKDVHGNVLIEGLACTFKRFSLTCLD